MYKRRRISEEREKILFEGAEPGTYIQFFKDGGSGDAFEVQAASAQAEDKPEKAPQAALPDGKAVLQNRISEYIFTRLSEAGIPSYFIKSLNMREQLVHTVEMLPLTVVCCNAVSGRMARRLGLAEGKALPHSVLEFYYKDENLSSPLVSEDHILAFGWANEQDLEEIIALTARINDFLCGLFAAIGLRLADFKLEFGRLWEGDMMRIVLADEISPASCRLWDRSLLEPSPPRASSRQTAAADRTAGSAPQQIARVGHRQVAQRLGLLNETRPLCAKGPVLVRS